jgi:hypothetical protein
MTRTVSAIALDIANAWPKPYFGAVPYLSAMLKIDDINGDYYEDTAASVVLYFLANAKTFRGDKARALKAELRSLLKENGHVA